MVRNISFTHPTLTTLSLKFTKIYNCQDPLILNVSTLYNAENSISPPKILIEVLRS
ncbi:hypothetical protein [Moorena producens]|uniref:hypothetical protein n=1 Tax=Moorena producens TaxID=1155739 RepID=UPI003C769043